MVGKSIQHNFYKRSSNGFNEQQKLDYKNDIHYLVSKQWSAY